MIAGLHSFAEEHQLFKPVDLSGATVGVSAEALAALNTAELTARLQSPNTKYVVVFDGPGRTTPSLLDDGICRRRILKVVVDCKIPFIVAPALAAAQLAYMYTQQFISHASGCDEVLLFGDVPLVVNLLNREIASEPQVLRRPDICQALNIPEPLFFEAAVGAGSIVIESPSIVKERNFDSVSTAAGAAIFSGQGSFFKAASVLLPPQYVSTLQKALIFVARQPIMLTDGNVVLSNKFNQPVPRDIVDVVGRELPPECYWYLNKGLLGPEYLKAAVFGTFTDCYQGRGTTDEERADLVKVEERLQTLRQQTYSLLSSNLHRYFQNKEVLSFTDGGANFTRSSVSFPNLSTETTTAITPESVVNDAVVHVKGILKRPDTTNKDLPETLVKSSGGDSSNLLLVRKVQLALREALEVTICWFMFTGKVERSINVNQIISLMPW